MCLLILREDDETGETVKCCTNHETKAELKAHMERHNHDDHWHCQYCQKKFGHFFNYHKHIKAAVHQKYKAYFYRKRFQKQREERLAKDKAKTTPRDYTIDYNLVGSTTANVIPEMTNIINDQNGEISEWNKEQIRVKNKIEKHIEKV